jgi:hypothetical protein
LGACYRVFGPLKEFPGSLVFQTDAAVKQAISQWLLGGQARNFILMGESVRAVNRALTDVSTLGVTVRKSSLLFDVYVTEFRFQ